MTRDELIAEFERRAKHEGFVLSINVDTSTGYPRKLFELVKPGAPKPKRKAEPDESMDWDKKGWKKVPT